jgi:MFS transporter, SP family, general alpha glucoside:H+ symporter
MWAFVIPFIFNPDRANLGAKTAFIFGAFSILSTAYLWWYHPETSRRSFEELDEMFVKGVPAWQFENCKSESREQAEAK